MKNTRILLAFILISCLSWPTLNAQMDEVFTLMHDGETREYEVHTPPGYDDSGDGYSLVINMHGLGSDRNQQKLYSAFNQVADTAGIVVVYPQGLPFDIGQGPQNHWNAGFGTGVDDIGFIDRMLDEIFEKYNIDPAKVYSTGMSNGGYMSYFLACELYDRIAAIASITGSMLQNVYNNCDPDRTVPIMQVHGTSDLVVPFNGNPTIDNVVGSWVDRNMCDDTPVVDSIPDIDPGDNTTTVKYTYTACDDESEIWYYVVDNGGHSWPGAFPFAPLGNTSQDFKASEHLWWFFRQYEHPNPRILTSEEKPVVSNVTVYPNPAFDELFIDGFKDKDQVRVSASDGRQYDIYLKGGRMNVEALPPGMYIGQLDDARFRFIKK